MKRASVMLYTAIFVFGHPPFVFGHPPFDTTRRTPRCIPEDATLNFTSLGAKYGLSVREHDVVTEDGYVLKLFHVPGDQSRPVLLMHGVVDSADTFIVRGNGSLVAALASAGYDVWVGNFRGTTYSRRHHTLCPDTDNGFWNFSFHEIGAYDLPALIDFILRENDVQQVSAIGHSQGNTIFYVLGSVRPEYNDKIKVLIALGPVCYLRSLQPPLSAAVAAGPLLNHLLLAFNQHEVFAQTSFLTYLKNTLCTHKVWGYQLCGGLFFRLAGEDKEEFDPDFFYTAIGHYPVGTSRNNVLHLMQLAKEQEFVQFDHGPRGNLQVYNSTSPPAYSLHKVTMKVALLVGSNDRITPLNNVGVLRDQLPRVVEYQVMDHPRFNHIDHVWGKNMHKYLFPSVMMILGKYS